MGLMSKIFFKKIISSIHAELDSKLSIIRVNKYSYHTLNKINLSAKFTTKKLTSKDMKINTNLRIERERLSRLNCESKTKKPFNSLKNNFFFLNLFLRPISDIHILILKAIKWTIVTFFWLKARISYYTNNWIYTTNHKRIAVNYFWFVILSGIVGMVLATIIRLEFAYPGVGVLAGDSIQYLSLASAHGVIMVFFMIMPLLFGAFANFLLPTQLGVHDVAFPRLNSAAFWFLPGGLLMLCQLVCIDRRYQRMNCFNIREAESLLKRRFFTDLINSKDQHVLLDKTAIGLRYKLNSNSSINTNTYNVYNYGLDLNPQIRSSSYFNIGNIIKGLDDVKSFETNSYFFKLISYFYSTNIFFLINSVFVFFLEKNFLNINLSSSLNEFFRIFNFFWKIFLSIKTFFFNIFFSIQNFFSFIGHFVKSFWDLVISFIIYHDDFYKNHFMSVTRVIRLSFRRYWLNQFIENAIEFVEDYFKYSIPHYKYNEFYVIDWKAFDFKAFDFKHFTGLVYKKFSTFIIYSIDSFNKATKLETEFDFKVHRYKIDYNFTEKNFFQNVYSIFKITMNNWLACFSPENNEYRWKCLTQFNVEIPTYRFKESSPISYKNFWDNTLSKYYLSSLILEVYSFIFLIFNIPILMISFLLCLTDRHFLTLNCTKFLNDSVFWIINTVRGTDVWKNEYTAKEILELKSIINESFYLRYFFFIRYQVIFTSYYQKSKDFFSDYTNFLFNFFKYSFKNSILLNIILEQIVIASSIYFEGIQNVWFSSNFYKMLCQIFEFFINLISFFIYNRFTKFIYKKIFFRIFQTENHVNVDSKDFFLLNNEELSSNSRFLRFDNPIFKYDYKSGDYFPKLYKDVYSFLIPSILDLTSGLRTPSWFFSSTLSEALESNLTDLLDNLEKKTNFDKFFAFPNKNNKITHSDLFYNFFLSLDNNSNDLNLKWISTNSLNTKFNRMFLTSSLQQRLYSNWRNLKFTREAWRCKMLLARHQKTLFRRYLHEDGVFWSIERNAKDLIPGWAMITPFSSRTRYTAVGKTDIGLMGVLLVLNSSIISGANFLVTYRYLSTLNNRKMRDARAFFTEAVMVASWMMILANPMLVIGIIMLISDRHWQTSFFDYSGGGDTVLFQHMFWFFGHPEVYIIIIPTFGFTNTMMSYYLKKRVSARASLLYSLYTIAFLGFFVWGHHMYMVGLSHTTRMLFSTLTVMISVPAATKIMHWCVTTANSAFTMELPLLFTFTFIFFFVSGGISGMCVAHTGMDVLFHDTFYVIGHFHVMLAGGAMFASFGAFYFYFPAIFGVKYSRIYAYLHYSYYLVGQLMTVIPMFWLGYAGMPRRVLDYPAAFGGWHSVISAGHMLNVAGLMAFFIMIFDSLRQAKAATRNTFGISRYNTRLNFYIYEISRLIYLQQKSFYALKTLRPHNLKLNNLNYINWEPYETVLFSYVLLKR